MPQREAHVRLAHAAARLAAHFIAEDLEAFGGERREQRLALRKMAVRRVMRDPRPARRLAQAKRSNPLFLQTFSRCPQERRTQVAMVIC
ncbi:MAG TPA: hypothetical protein VIH38_01310 [Steroidobacteraceae bacterium]